MINGAPCRLLDIQELLSDTGIGRQQHVIVGQGQLDAVLNARPEDRRAIIEEAAGILKFRKRQGEGAAPARSHRRQSAPAHRSLARSTPPAPAARTPGRRGAAPRRHRRGVARHPVAPCRSRDRPLAWPRATARRLPRRARATRSKTSACGCVRSTTRYSRPSARSRSPEATMSPICWLGPRRCANVHVVSRISSPNAGGARPRARRRRRRRRRRNARRRGRARARTAGRGGGRCSSSLSPMRIEVEEAEAKVEAVGVVSVTVAEAELQRATQELEGADFPGRNDRGGLARVRNDLARVAAERADVDAQRAKIEANAARGRSRSGADRGGGARRRFPRAHRRSPRVALGRGSRSARPTPCIAVPSVRRRAAGRVRRCSRLALEEAHAAVGGDDIGRTRRHDRAAGRSARRRRRLRGRGRGRARRRAQGDRRRR